MADGKPTTKTRSMAWKTGLSRPRDVVAPSLFAVAMLTGKKIRAVADLDNDDGTALLGRQLRRQLGRVGVAGSDPTGRSNDLMKGSIECSIERSIECSVAARYR